MVGLIQCINPHKSPYPLVGKAYSASCSPGHSEYYCLFLVKKEFLSR